jgi:hypothetical protein
MPAPRHAAPALTVGEKIAETTDRAIAAVEGWGRATAAVTRRLLTPTPATVDGHTRIADRFDADA